VTDNPRKKDEESSAESPGVAGLKQRARKGVLVLILRSVSVQLIYLAGMVLLARLLEPTDFGVFAIVQFALQFFGHFGDTGFGAALVQQTGAPTREELSSVFFFQLFLSIVIIALVWYGAEGLHLLWTDLPEGTTWLLRAISITLLLTCLRVVPSLLMERHLEFGRLALVEVSQSLAFYLVAVAFAFGGYGVWSLVAGVVAQGVVGVVGAYIARPFIPRLICRWTLLRPIIRFGIPFQLKTIVGFANAAVTPLYGGAVLGTKAVGFVNWAQGVAYYPLRLVEVMARVSFPLFSRFKNDEELLAKSLGRSIHLCALVTFFVVGVFLGLGPQVIEVIYTAKWMPALPLLYIFAGAISIGFLSPLVGAAFDAMGQPKVFMKLAFGWTLINWVAVPIGSYLGGMIGFTAGYAVHVVVGNLVVIALLVKEVPLIKLWPQVRAGLLGAVAVWAFGAYLAAPYANSIVGFCLAVVLALFIFALIVLALDRKTLAEIKAMAGGGRMDEGQK
jgi:O-antigen/teichoic acid export membrane protein